MWTAGGTTPCGSVLVLLVHLAQQEVKCRAMRPGGGVRAMENAPLAAVLQGVGGDAAQGAGLLEGLRVVLRQKPR